MTAAFGVVIMTIALFVLHCQRACHSVVCLAAVAACSASMAALWGRPLRVQVQIRLHHVVQFAMHSAIFVYWAIVVDEVMDQVWLYIAQIMIAYGPISF